MKRTRLLSMALSLAFAPAVLGAEPPRAFPPKEGFDIGVNYWASHAGMYMWRNWNAAQVERDLDRLAEQGITVLRVFPLWPDFQPLTAAFRGRGVFRCWTQNDGALKNYAAVDDGMVERFRFLCRAAEKRNLGLVVGLVTGWMSGRMFVPPALERKNALTDAESIMWQTRYVRYLVEALKNERAIVAWDLGNECNAMGTATRAEFRNWMHAIASSIRLADASRPVVSGMHSVSPKTDDMTNVRDQGELTDILTTHPYPLWTPGCNTEPFDTLRNGCHAACETTWYADLAAKPAFVEEAGSMGPGIVSEARAAASMRTALFSCWAAGIKSYMWWCAFDQNKLKFAPYDWAAIERELGVFKADGTPKPQAREMKKFRDFLDSLPFKALPPRRIDATVIVSEQEHAWRTSLGAWLLAKQAGFDVRYTLAESPLPDAPFYILPSGRTYNAYLGSTWDDLREKVKAGATALVTLGEGTVLSDLAETAGIEVENHWEAPCTLNVDCGADSFAFTEPYTRELSLKGASVLLKTRDGRPFMTEYAYGKGRLLFVNGAIESNAQLAAWPVYRLAAARAGVKRAVTRADPQLGLTEHPAEDGRIYAVAVNHSPRTMVFPLQVSGKVSRVWNGHYAGGSLSLGANEGCVMEITNKEKHDDR